MSNLFLPMKLDEVQAPAVLGLGRSISTPTDNVARNAPSKGANKLSTVNSGIAACNCNDRPSNGIFGRSTPFETDFMVDELLGEGGFGRIYKCKSNVDGCWYAVKLEQFWFKPQAYFNPSEVRDVMMNEALVLAHLDHENVCRYYNTWVTGSLVPIDSVGKRIDVLATKVLEVDPPKRRYSPARRVSSSTDFASFVNAANRFVPARTTASFDEEDPQLDLSFGLPSPGARAHVLHSNKLLDFSDLGFEMEASDTGDDTGDTFEDSVSMARPTTTNVPRRKLTVDPGASAGSLCTQIDVYIQMALYDGDTLQHWIEQRQSVNTAETLRIFRQIVAGLKYIHNQGLIHRDIKPANIFLTKKSCVKIGDFGLAKNTLQSSLHIPPSQYYLDDGSLPSDVDESTLSTTAGVGTPLYSSPEQTSGQPCDASTDVFSLGILLCELFLSFSTQMERFVTLSSLRKGNIPAALQQSYPEIAPLVEQMVCTDPRRRLSCAEIEECAVRSRLWHDSHSATALAAAITPAATIASKSVTATQPTHVIAHQKLTDLLLRLEHLEREHDTILHHLGDDNCAKSLSAIAVARKSIYRELHELANLTKD